MNPSLITKTAVVGRPGWSQTLVLRLLGEPDSRKKVFGRSIPIALYALDRVMRAEKCPEFQDAQRALSMRKAASVKAVATKTAKLLEAIQAMPIKVQQLGIGEVRRRAIDHYNHRQEGGGFASITDDAAFLDRIMVNFVRHELTQYDMALGDAAGKTGIRLAVAAIRKRVYGAIATVYPHLAVECERQLVERTCG